VRASRAAALKARTVPSSCISSSHRAFINKPP
jgi:hypothetical protein